MTIGIYKLYNVINNNTYLGQSKNIENRFLTHIEDLANNKHHQINLQKEYNKYKEILKEEYKNNEMFNYLNFDKLTIDRYYKLEIIETFLEYDKENLSIIEDEYILKYRSIQEGYKQKTNKEIEEERKDILEIIKEYYLKYPELMNYKKEDREKEVLKVAEQIRTGKLTLKNGIWKSFNIGKKYAEEYLDSKRNKNIKIEFEQIKE